MKVDVEENGRIKMRININNKEFENIFQQFKTIELTQLRQSSANYNYNGQRFQKQIRIISNGNSIIEMFRFYKLTKSQFKKMVDWCLLNSDDEDKLFRIFSFLADSECHQVISEESYAYALENIAEKVDVIKYEDIISQILYFKTTDYYSDYQEKKCREKMSRRQEITLKYLENFKFSNPDFFTDLEYKTRDIKYQFKDYNYASAFNDWLYEFSQKTNGLIEYDDFKIEDNLEEFLWKEN